MRPEDGRTGLKADSGPFRKSREALIALVTLQEALMALVGPQMQALQRLDQALAEYSGVAARPTGAADGKESLETSGPKKRGQVCEQ